MPGIEPDFCPFCGTQGTLEERPSSMLEIDDDYWLIFHWSCTTCGEQFDRVELSPVAVDPEDLIDADERA